MQIHYNYQKFRDFLKYYKKFSIKVTMQVNISILSTNEKLSTFSMGARVYSCLTLVKNLAGSRGEQTL